MFGDRATTPLDEGLGAMAAWVKRQGARSSAPFDGIEIQKNLPPSWRQPRARVPRNADIAIVHGSKTITVVLPAYNEEGYIRPAVDDFFVPNVVDEVIVVDNNSRDRTADEARQTRARVVQESRSRDTAMRCSAASARPPATS